MCCLVLQKSQTGLKCYWRIIYLLLIYFTTVAHQHSVTAASPLHNNGKSALTAFVHLFMPSPVLLFGVLCSVLFLKTRPGVTAERRIEEIENKHACRQNHMDAVEF